MLQNDLFRLRIALVDDPLYLAVDTFRNRFHYDLSVQNPLPKMYHERKEDGEKARFAVRKKLDFEKKGE